MFFRFTLHTLKSKLLILSEKLRLTTMSSLFVHATRAMVMEARNCIAADDGYKEVYTSIKEAPKKLKVVYECNNEESIA